MRVRNPQTGTVVSVGEETGKRYLAAGWEDAEEKSARSAPDAGDGETKTRRRRASR